MDNASTPHQNQDNPTPEVRPGPGAYALGAPIYRRVGWLGVLPSDYPGVGMPPPGFTGGRTQPNWEVYPGEDQIATWIAERGSASLGVRVPPDVLVVDVDAYDGKKGAETLEWWVDQVGEPLPPTWYSTSRQDGSMKLFFRVPTYDVGYRWREPGDGLELLHHGHRWVRVWPSRNPKTGGEERWFSPLGLEERVPTVDDFTPLPESWIRAFQTNRRSRSGVGRGHHADQVHINDFDGNPVDPRQVLVYGLPVGSQENELFRWVCSLRERRQHIDEAKVLGTAAFQRLENGRPEDPWTLQQIHAMIDRVWDTYEPGTPLTLPPEIRELAARLAAQSRDGVTRVEVGEPETRDANASDLGNTVRFVALHRDLARYAADAKRWYVWDGRRWSLDRTNRVMDLTKNVVDAIRAEAVAGDADRDAVARWMAWANQSESIARRKAMVEGALSEPALVTTTDALDSDEHLLVVRNGTVDLRTGELRASRPGDLCTHLAEVDFDAEAECPRWQAHVDFMCNGDPALVAYIQRAVGYTLTGDVGERNFFILEGTGSNGKNAFVEPLMAVMGSYAQAASTALLTGGDEQHPTILADLVGARLVFVDETRANKQLNVERVKALTGSKRVKARHMKQDFFEYEARFKLWIAGNGQPKWNDPSDGVWARMHRVRCLGKVDESRKIKNYGDLLYQEEASGILNWALQGLRDWWKLGSLGTPGSVTADVQAYRDEEDYVGQFMDECLVRTGDADDAVTASEIFGSYQVWAALAGLKGVDVLNRTHLGRALTAHGLGSVQRRRDGVVARWVTGVRLVDRASVG